MQSGLLIGEELRENRRSDGRLHLGWLWMQANVSNGPFSGDRISDSRTTVHRLSELAAGLTSLFSTGFVDAKSFDTLIISSAD
jgi:hypothetical protein